MKHTKRIASLLLALVMVFSLAVTASAENSNKHTITINNSTSGYTYVAYQIFKGDLVNGQLQNIAWGGNIDTTKEAELLAALQANENFADCKNVVDVATKLAENQADNNDVTKAFADIVAGYLTEAVAGTSTYNETSMHYTIPVTGDGYYLVKNTAVPTDSDDTSYTRYILKVVDDVSVSHKGEVPKVEKKIIVKEDDTSTEADETERADANTADIGDTIKYEIVGTMPSNIADCDTYYYVFTDTLSKGLTYTNNLKVTVNGVDVTTYFYDNVTVNNDGTTTLIVGIDDILALENLPAEGQTAPVVGQIINTTKVVVTYTALLNEDAVVGVNGNTNEVELDYSNDPNNDGDGTTNPPPTEPSEPKPETPTGETPKDTVITFTTEIKLTKVDKLTQKILTGAKFEISGVSSNVNVINKVMYVAYAEGETTVEGNVWYMLKDGTYTKNAPTTDNADTTDVNEDNTADYDSTTKTYKQVTEVTTETVTTPFVAEGWVYENGVITFTGLGEGTYTIKEMVAPNGYNLLTEDITVVITSNAATITNPTAATTVTWNATVDGKDATIKNGVVELTVENTSGATLPETGGMGTTLFYIVGGLMVLAAVVLLVTKKRMASAE